MSERNEFLDSLKSQAKDKVAILTEAQDQGRAAYVKLDEAHKTKDQSLVDTASNEFEGKSTVIREAQAELQKLQDQISLFAEVDVPSDSPATKSAPSKEEMQALLEQYNLKNEGKSKKSVGETFADMLQFHGIKRVSDLERGNWLRLTALIGKDDAEAVEAVKSDKEAKSLYTNHGVQLLDGSSNPIPGFVGYQCGLVEDPYTCALTLPPDEFEDCLTVLNMPRGNRLRYTRMVSRTDNAGVVLETVYNPYPTFARNGTKPEGTFTLATSEVNDTKIAEFVTASDEVLEDCPTVASMINDFLITGIEQKKRQQLISGTGSSGQMRGILNQPDLLTRVHRGSPNGTAQDNIWDTFRRSMTDLYITGTNTANLCVIMNPLDTEIIDLLKDDNGRYLFANQNGDCITRSLGCLTVTRSTSIPQGTAIIGALKDNWIFYVRKALEIRMGYTGDQFITNTQTILGEMRGLTMVRCPQHIERVTGIAI